MTEAQGEQSVRIAFGDFLIYLQEKGFKIGVDHHLRLQQLLARVAGHCQPAELKTLLCPIFANSRDRQREFYRAFDEFFAIFQPAEAGPSPQPQPAPAPPDEPIAPKPAPRRSRALIATLLSVSLITLAAISLRSERFQLLVGLKQLALPEPELVIPRPPASVIVAVIPPVNTSPTPAPTPPRDWVIDYRWQLRLSALLAPLTIFALWTLWRWWRRRPVIEKAQGRRPPFTWPIELEQEEWRLDRSQTFYQAARGLRRRQRDDFEHLDLPRTTDATIEARGYPSFRFRRASRPPEYLVLIDRASAHDHQARLFDQLAQALDREGLFIARFFYNGDPRVCRETATKREFYLADLHRKFPAHRLVLMGDGARLLDPVTGEFTAWSALLTEWEERAILTPVSLPAWRRRERALSESFTLLPATLAGVAELAERYELPLGDERRRDDRASDAAPPDTDYDVTVKELEGYLGPDAFQWLCACAVYPELQWELTLKLGQLALPPETAAQPSARLDEALLWRLLRLPWFRKGLIPDLVRLELVRALDPAVARRVRQFLIKTLEDNPAEEGTYAADERRLDIAVQRAYLAGDDRRKRKAALKEIEHLEPGELQRDYTLLRLLEDRPTSLLALALPARLRKLFYPEGLSHYGMKWKAALALALIAALLVWGGVEGLIRYRKAHQPKPNPTPKATPAPTPQISPTPNVSPTPSPTGTRTPTPSPTATVVPGPEPPGESASLAAVNLPTGINLELVYVPGGRFTMGSPASEAGRADDEGPQHQVTVPGFYMGKFEVTQAQWRAVMGNNPSYFKGDNLPVEQVSWNDAQEFCKKLSQLTGKTFRLPSEAEWEYAARAGTTGAYAGNLDAMAWYANNSGKMTHPVGEKKSNAFGLFDMHGNVYEWCQDVWHDNYNGAPTDGSAWLSGGDSSYRVLRGGSWYALGRHCRSASRYAYEPVARYSYFGFRIVVGARSP